MSQCMFMCLPTYDVQEIAYVVQDVNGGVIGRASRLDERAFANYLFTPAEDYLKPRSGSLAEQLAWLEALPDVTGGDK